MSVRGDFMISKEAKEEILKRGYIDVKVFVAGLRQSHRLTVTIETTTHGEIQFLTSKHYIPSSELVRLSEELQFPIKHKDTIVFPPGTMPANLAKKQIATFESDTLEAEIE